MAKQTITQRSFVIGEPREEFLEADDLDLRLASLRTARNVRIKATRTVDQKLGSVFKRTLVEDTPIYEVRPAAEAVYGVIVRSQSLQIVDSDGSVIYQLIGTFDFGAPEEVWVEGFGPDVVIGTPNGIKTLRYDNGSWSFSNTFAFSEAPGQQLAQPYWSYVQGITLTPSALTGSITVTASDDLFTSQYVGLRIRYGYREILITGYTSPTSVTGTVQSRLPPTYRISLTSNTNFQIGDPVIGQDTGFEGLVVAKSGATDIDVLTLRFLDGPDTGEKISAPSATSDVTGKTSITPAASPVWDEPLMSNVRGWPKSGTSASGRLVLADFPQAPDVIAASSVREVFDFLVGDEDDDAIVRAVGDNRPRFLHVVNAGDLLLLADQGVYMVELRGNTALTPATFVPRLVDRRGCSTVKPARVDDGVIFLEASGKAIAVALLDGNIYLKWSVKTISTFHAHLIDAPISMCGPPPNTDLPEKYLFIVNGDGTMAVMSWVDGFDPENVGFVLWDTQGSYLRISPVFGKYWATVVRSVNEADVIMLEELSPDALVDCASSVGSIDPIFEGQSLSICGPGWYAGEQIIGTGGTLDGTFPEDAMVGWNYQSVAGLWPQEQVNHPKAGILAARVIRAGVSVLHTGPFAIKCNNITQRFGGYAFGMDLLDPPPPVTKLYRCSVIGRRDHPTIDIIKETPGLFQILAATQEVTF